MGYIYPMEIRSHSGSSSMGYVYPMERATLAQVRAWLAHSSAACRMAVAAGVGPARADAGGAGVLRRRRLPVCARQARLRPRGALVGLSSGLEAAGGGVLAGGHGMAAAAAALVGGGPGWAMAVQYYLLRCGTCSSPRFPRRRAGALLGGRPLGCGAPLGDGLRDDYRYWLVVECGCRTSSWWWRSSSATSS